MRELHESDFAPLDDFPLLWRWTKPSHDVLPSAVLATIQPLSATAATELALERAARCADRGAAEWQMTIKAESGEEIRVREWLEALDIEPEARVVVSWDRGTAVATLWQTFVAHWDAFCYPSSDDVSVWTPGAEWMLCFRHVAVFEFSASHPAV